MATKADVLVVADDVRIAYATAPPAEARILARGAVESKLAACAQLSAPMTSIYEWEGKLEESEETLITFKTTSARVSELATFIKEKHSYDTAEILVTKVELAAVDYLDWLRTNTER